MNMRQLQQQGHAVKVQLKRLLQHAIILHVGYMQCTTHMKTRKLSDAPHTEESVRLWKVLLLRG